MTDAQRDKYIMEIHAKVSVIEGLAARHDQTLYGNGQPGVCKRLDQMEIQQRDCPAREDFSHSARNNRLTAIGILVSVLLSICAMIVGAFKP